MTNVGEVKNEGEQKTEQTFNKLFLIKGFN